MVVLVLVGGGFWWKGSGVDDSLELARHHRFFEDSGASHSLRQQQYGDRSQPFQEVALLMIRQDPFLSLTERVHRRVPLSLRKPNSLLPPPLFITSSTLTADTTIPPSTPSLPTPTPLTPADKHYSFGLV